MPRHHIEIQHHFQSPPAKVFAFFADHESFGRIWPGTTRRIRTGQDSPNGEGSVREIRVGPVSFEETTTVHEAPQRLVYQITRGSPLKNHRGEIRFLPASDGGCQLDYHIEFDGRWPLIGALVARQLPRDFATGITALRLDLPRSRRSTL